MRLIAPMLKRTFLARQRLFLTSPLEFWVPLQLGRVFEKLRGTNGDQRQDVDGNGRDQRSRAFILWILLVVQHSEYSKFWFPLNNRGSQNKLVFPILIQLLVNDLRIRLQLSSIQTFYFNLVVGLTSSFASPRRRRPVSQAVVGRLHKASSRPRTIALLSRLQRPRCAWPRGRGTSGRG